MIETQRLIIRPLEYKELLRYVIGRKGEIETDEDEKLFFQNLIEPYRAASENEKLFYTLWIAQNESGEIVGDVNFKGSPNEFGMVEVGYYVKPEYRDKGYATEMVNAMTNWANKDERVVFVLAFIDYENMASKRVIEKCGFRKLSNYETRHTFIKQLKF